MSGRRREEDSGSVWCMSQGEEIGRERELYG